MRKPCYGMVLTHDMLDNLIRKKSTSIGLYHLNNTGELAEIRAYLISEHGEIKTFTPTY